MVNSRVAEATSLLRAKEIRSTTLERCRLLWEAHNRIGESAQPLQLGEGLYYLLGNIDTPVANTDLVVGRIREETPDAAGEAFLRARIEQWPPFGMPPWLKDVGHICFAWDRLLKLGLSGLEETAREKRRLMAVEGANRKQIDFLTGAIRVYQAFRLYARRYADAAKRVDSAECAAHCVAAAERAPRTFTEALQLIWLVGLVYCAMVTPNPAISFGRMDELLLDYYLNDIRNGILTRRKAGDLIEDFYCKTNLIMGRGEHQMGINSAKSTGWARNLCYDSPLYLVLAGRRYGGIAVSSDLTTLFLERMVPRLKNPVVILRYTPDLPEDVWRLACEKMAANSGLHVFNDDCVVPAMIHAGIREEDAASYTMHGCNEPDIPGIQRMVGYSFDNSFMLPRYFLEALFASPDDTPSVDSIYSRFFTSIAADIHEKCDEFRRVRRQWAEDLPGYLRVDDCFLKGSVEKARSWDCGGLEYRNLFFSLYSLATAADSFAAVDELVFRRKRVTLEELKEALENDFTGREDVRQLCLHAPKFGRDDGSADRHAVRILETIGREIDGESAVGTVDEVIVFRCLYTIMGHLSAGEHLGATPDGRRAGHPTSENMSPSPGACTAGLTAMLTSVAKLPLDRINTGILNMRLRPELFSGDGGIERLMSLFQAFFEKGGLQVQVSVAGTEELIDAQANPHRHKDLMVRITGYSALFTDMTPDAQNEIIRREEMGSFQGSHHLVL